MRRYSVVSVGLGLMILALLNVAVVPAQAQDFKAILANPERPQNERALDAARKPEEALRFYGVKPGDKVADIMTGRGYYAAILSLLVGDKGMVYAANETVRKELAARFQNPLYASVKLIEGKMDALALPSDGSLDFVLIHLNYHDLAPETRTAMNRRIFAALKPGGAYGVVDHSAKDGSGNQFTQSLHRIDKALVIKEVTEAGFVLVQEGDMLRHPEEPRTESVFKDRGNSDRFVLRFEKPR
ncbi:methyltransferase domain-containing protein [bacterium]|nr:MAG: methyltransferase domain-containing protein [bacterium]